MKKLAIILTMTVALSSCYEDYVGDFDYSSVYFYYQENARTLVAGEGMAIDLGVNLAGVMENRIERTVSFMVDPALLDGTGYEMLPADYYSLSSDNKMVIYPGQHLGRITLTGDFAKITADPDMLPDGDLRYALPLTITSAEGIDTILQTKKSTIIPIRYEHMLFGSYWHDSEMVVRRAQGDTTISYKSEFNDADQKVWMLSTMVGNRVKATGELQGLDGNSFSVEMEMVLEGNTVGISSIEGAEWEVSGTGTFTNESGKLEERVLDITYQFVKDGFVHEATDKLMFRSRIRDDIREWQGYGATVRE